MEALFLIAKRFLSGLVILAAGFCGGPSVFAQEPTALYISPAGHNFRADGMPLQSAESVQASLLLSATMGIKRVYWRGFQEQYLTRHALRRPANFSLFEYWEWLRELDETRGIHRAAIKTAAEAGMEIWGVIGLFDHGSDPREDAYCGAASGYGPAVYTDSLRIEFPGEIPKDSEGIRSQCGTLRLTHPVVRKKLIERLIALMDEGYQGLLLYTYMENLSLWFPGEFDRGNLGPLTADEVTFFVRELREELSKKNKRLALQIDPREAFRDLPSPWLGLTPDVNTIGNVPVAWEEWLREGLLDEVVFSVPSDAEAEAVKLAGEVAQKFPKLPVSLLARQAWPKTSLALAVDARSPEWRARFQQRAESVDALRQWAECTDARPPELTKVFDSDSAAVVAALASAIQAPSSSNALSVGKLVKHRKEYPIRAQAGETLGAWGADANEALALLAADQDPSIRRVAFSAANKLTPFELARPLLDQAVCDPDPYNRWVGFRGLARATMDPALQETVRQALKNDPDPTVRSVAAWLIRPGMKIEPALFETLCARFVALHEDKSWSWEYRTVGDALFGNGPDGRAFLEKCLNQKENLNLADSAWRCLYVRQNGGNLILVDQPTARKAYEAYPKKGQ